MTQALKKYGIKRNKKTVAKIMQQEGLQAKTRHKRAYNSYKGTVGKIAPNVLKRDFKATCPLQKMSSDVVQFSVNDKKIYLSPLIDLWNGEVISWRIGMRPSMKMVLDTLKDAKERLSGSKAIIHTDQGFQYQNKQWVIALKEMGCIQSMSRKGNCLDNAPAESFFGRLKTEFSDGSNYNSPVRFMADLHSWIYWYNEKRIKGSLCGMAPLEYRKQYETMTI